MAIINFPIKNPPKQLIIHGHGVMGPVGIQLFEHRPLALADAARSCK
jgi:hypothetical protein